MSVQVSPARYTPGYRLLFAFTIPWLLAAVAMTADILLHPLEPEAYFGSVALRLVGGLVLAPLIILVGMLCVRHSPGNIVGLLLVLAGAGHSMTTVRADANILLVNMSGYLGVVLFWISFILLILYFPDGKPYFLRAGIWMGRGMALVVFIAFVTQIFGQPHLTYSARGSNQGSENPFYTQGLEPLSAFGSVVFPVFASVYMVFVLVSLVARYRAARLPERQQLKWFLWGFAVWLAPQVISDSPGIPAVVNDAISVYSKIGAGLLPVVTVGPAILLNKLWDIDIIIRRTLVYSILTALLALTYWGGVALLQYLLRPLTGEGSDIAVVMTTLAVVIIFLPLRRLIQGFIDKRFYRRKYDAAHTLQAFSTHVRDEVDLKALAGHLVQVVDDTMRPEHVSLWLRPPTGTNREHPL